MDQRLRELEREASRDPDWVRALLHARARAGDARVFCAAYLGDSDAMLAVGSTSSPPVEPPDLVLGLKPFGAPAFLRAAVAAATFLLPATEGVIASIQGWLDCPCDSCGKALRESARRAHLGCWEPARVGPVVTLVRMAIPPRPTRVRREERDRRCGGRTAQREHWWCPSRAVRRRRFETSARSEDEVREAVVAAVLEWALPGESA